MSVNSMCCPICMKGFSSLQGRLPMIVCNKGHSMCADCVRVVPYCAYCLQPKIGNLIVNIALLELVETTVKSLKAIPQIPFEQITLSKTPFSSGSFSKVYDAKWFSQDVVVKVLKTYGSVDSLNELRLETSLAMSLYHPNIVKVFGAVQMPNNRSGIVMEKADNGSLKSWMEKQKLSPSQKVTVCLGVVDGLSYLHRAKVAHRDLKPDNLLLFGSAPICKISDFGTSKVMTASVTNTVGVGTIVYMAPELFTKEGAHYAHSVDIYSLALIIYELFSGASPMDIYAEKMRGKVPTIPPTFPKPLAKVVEDGWSNVPTQRPSLDTFRQSFQQLQSVPKVVEQTTKEVTLTMQQQCDQVSYAIPAVPLIGLAWSTSCETFNSLQLRKDMVHLLRTVSFYQNSICASVLLAMEVVPRHLFVEESRIPTGYTCQIAYQYNKPMPSTMYTDEVSPEIIGTLLSLVNIQPGCNVMVVGCWGGYVPALVAQITGINGSVIVIVPDNKNVTLMSKIRIHLHCPLHHTMTWIVEDHVNPNSIMSSVNRQFHAIVYCASVEQLPIEMSSLLLPGGSLVVAVRVTPSSLQLQVVTVREGENCREICVALLNHFPFYFQ